MYYLGGDNGKVYAYSEDYTADGDYPINCSWISKITDFVDENPACDNKWKTVYKAKLLYEDVGSDVAVTVSTYTDSEDNWSDVSETFGENDTYTKSKNYYLIKTGRDFQFKIMHNSSDKTFIWLGLEVDYEIGGDWFGVG